jgi:DNA-binding XRE family transcriptional regulator
MSQEELAKALGKTRTAVAQYETGKNTPPLKMIEQIAGILEVDPAFLAFGGSPSDLPSQVSLSMAKAGEGRDGAATYQVPASVAQRMKVTSSQGAVFELSCDAPHFTLRRGDHVFVDTSQTDFRGDGRLYLVRSGIGELHVARAEVQLSGGSSTLNVTLGNGQNQVVEGNKIEVAGLIVATLRFE